MANLHLSWTEPDTNNEWTRAIDRTRRNAIVRDMRAHELERALKAAVDDAPLWRLQAFRLLAEIADGILPAHPKEYRHDHA